MSLDAFDGAYNPQDTGRPMSLENLHDGTYTFRVLSAELTQTQKTGEDILRWVYEVISGLDHTGSKVESVNFFRSQMAVNLLGADLALLGLPTSTWTVANNKPFSKMLRESLPGLIGVTFTASKVSTTKDTPNGAKTYHNLRIKSRVDNAAPMPSDPAGTFQPIATDSNGLPF